MTTKKFTPPIYEEMEEEGDIDHVLKQELKDAGLEYRFIDFRQAKLNGGTSRAGWMIYRRQSPDPRFVNIPGLADADGLVRKGSLVLAVKTQKAAAKQRERRDAQNRVNNKYTEHVTKELDGVARKLGGSSRVIAGYDKNS